MAPSTDASVQAKMLTSLARLSTVLHECAASVDNAVKVLSDGGSFGDPTEATGKRKRAKKDVNAPKRPASSYILYQNEKRKELQEKFPDSSFQELMKLVAEQWNKLDDAQRKPWVEQHAAADTIYKENMATYKANKDSAPPDGETSSVASPAPVKKPRGRPPKSAKAAVAPAKATKKAALKSPEHVEDSEDDSVDSDGSADTAPPPKPAPKASAKKEVASDDSGSEDSEEEDSEEEEAKPPPKKQKTVAPAKDIKKRK
ncbi:HMG-box [Cylindrobasidium torrendii FP15055 ss-10]|uniref:HMG-box n=1 Tax=Cylindrobasidium torrendii FP15055 ss-10 TaxID=1314674 RepID=A0A0D7BSR4_9AGAR|nr:HMG-box [Cylindrobasidium torrendii FP15055 ss-10]